MHTTPFIHLSFSTLDKKKQKKKWIFEKGKTNRINVITLVCLARILIQLNFILLRHCVFIFRFFWLVFFSLTVSDPIMLIGATFFSGIKIMISIPKGKWFIFVRWPYSQSRQRWDCSFSYPFPNRLNHRAIHIVSIFKFSIIK